ncbi:phage major capsid protein [Polaribacter haliotis]|uniref:Phage major capsid protein n=1 Tax=Polaribacter haliotis TaxID=1888915 RepID=A0A7L8AFB1_9FLAO|nr:phage major capsid protein [Polaribacter haliotis]QOD60650.1 phage major capsid protein [Polaribacter haliotis]
MKSSVELKQERASLKDKQTALITKAKTEKREMSNEENTSFDDLMTQRNALDAQILRAEQIEKDEADASRNAGTVVGAPAVKPEKKSGNFSLLRSLRSLSKGQELHPDDAKVHEQAQEEMRASGLELPEGNAISIPTGALRAQTVTGDSGAKGGALVASTPKLVRPLQPVLPIESLGVNIMSGLVGDVPLPTSGAFSFSYGSETATTAATDIGFAGPTLKPKRCSGVVDISKKLLAQTSFSVEDYILEQINIAYGNTITLAAINGSGEAPTGLYSLITTNVNTTAGALTHATAVALEGLVDAADGTNVKRAYLADPKVKSGAKTTKIDAGSGVFLSDGNTLNGYPFISTTLMPLLDTDKHPIIFGDWNQLTVGYWDTLSIIVDPYTQAASGKVRLIIEGFSDVAVTNEKAFAINKVVTV